MLTLSHCKRVGQNHPERDTVFGKSPQKYLLSISKRREGNKNKQHVYLLPTLDQVRQEFTSTTKPPNPSWKDDRKELFD